MKDFFANLTINRRLTYLLGAIIGTFALITAAYLWTVYTETTAYKRSLHINEFGASVDLLESEMLQARRSEKDFLLRRDPKYVKQHAEVLAGFFTEIDRAKALAFTAEQTKQLADVAAAMKGYEASFQTVADTQTGLGLDETQGLQGKLRDAVHKLEDVLKDHQYQNLTISMLQLRRHEKDFILREDEKYIKQHSEEMARLLRGINELSISADIKKTLLDNARLYQDSFAEFSTGTLKVNESVAAMREAAHTTEPLFEDMAKQKKQTLAEEEAAVSRTNLIAQWGFAAFLTTIAAALYFVFNFLSRSITNPLNHLTESIEKVAGGQYDVRTRLATQDELGVLSRTFDKLLDDRLASLVQIQKENEQLNNSVLNLLQAVANLSRKDLTVKVPVSEDVTGAVADALNLLTTETGKVLQSVTDISADVASASMKVKDQSNTAASVAETERVEVERAAHELEEAARTMNNIASLARTANEAADEAIKTTQSALRTVTDTVDGINSTRETIRETEKRIKRLGERSQEITGVVNLINSIAERTHILALNASMHAASAGEAGRGFAVVADEVQRLAENARQATAQISALVSNIQIETADTVSAMNTAITQVVDGSKLAEAAGEQMKLTQQTTASLVASVQQIAHQSVEQAKVSNDLMVRAKEIQKSTVATSERLREQTEHTDNLVDYARRLLESVRVFKLPA